MKGAGGEYKERQKKWVSYPDFGKYLNRGSLAAHFQTQHGIVKGFPIQEGEGEGGGENPRTYKM